MPYWSAIIFHKGRVGCHEVMIHNTSFFLALINALDTHCPGTAWSKVVLSFPFFFFFPWKNCQSRHYGSHWNIPCTRAQGDQKVELHQLTHVGWGVGMGGC